VSVAAMAAMVATAQAQKPPIIRQSTVPNIPQKPATPEKATTTGTGSID